MKTFEYIIYFCMTAGVFFGDTPLSKYLGAFGYSWLSSFSLIAMLMYVLVKRKIVLTKFTKGMINLEIWLILSSIISIVFFYVLNGYMVVKGENLIVKAVKNNLNWISFLSYLILLYNMLYDMKLEEKYILLPFVVIFLVSIIFSHLEYNRIPYAFENLHVAGIFPYYRIRMLTTESSSTCSLIMLSFILTLKYSLDVKKSKLYTVLTFLGLIYLILVSGSKSLMSMFFLFVILYFFKKEKSYTLKIIKILFCIVSIFVLQSYVIPKLNGMISSDLESYTSTFTRSYTIVISVVHSIIFFFGVGNSVYLSTFIKLLSDNLENYLNFCSSIGIKFKKVNVSEIKEKYIYSMGDQGISVKSGIFEYGVYWGILGNLYLFKLLYGLYKTIKQDSILKIGFVICICCQLFNGLTFDFWAFLAVAMYYGQKRITV